MIESKAHKWWSLARIEGKKTQTHNTEPNFQRAAELLRNSIQRKPVQNAKHVTSFEYHSGILQSAFLLLCALGVCLGILRLWTMVVSLMGLNQFLIKFVADEAESCVHGEIL